MKKMILLLMTVTLLSGCQTHQSTEPEQKQKTVSNQEESQVQEDSDNMEIIMTINEQDFVIELENNETTQALVELLPMSMTMEDLNANEKYYYMTQQLPTNNQNIGQIKAGDFMLFGNNCLVLFYESFSTSYMYTRLGKIQNVEAFLNMIQDENDINVNLHQ